MGSNPSLDPLAEEKFKKEFYKAEEPQEREVKPKEESPVEVNKPS